MKKLPPPRDFVPDFNPLFNRVCNYVKKNQGDKGYIDTQDESFDTIYTVVYDEEEGRAIEKRVHGVRWNPETKDLEIVFDEIYRTCVITYTEDDFKDSKNWWSVRWSDVYFVHTLINIAECIDEYVEPEK